MLRACCEPRRCLLLYALSKPSRLSSHGQDAFRCHATKFCFSLLALSTTSHAPQVSKTLLAEKVESGEGLHNHRNRDVGFLAALRTMIFGARDPESDLSIETLEELHMVTGCELCSLSPSYVLHRLTYVVATSVACGLLWRPRLRACSWVPTATKGR